MRVAEADPAQEWGRFEGGSPERRILDAAGEAIGSPVRPRRLLLDNGNSVEVEGMDADQRVVLQVIRNQGSYKAAYRNKVLADMFKLAWIRRSMPSVRRAVLVVTGSVRPAFGGWVRVAAQEMEIEVLLFDGTAVVPLPPIVYTPATRDVG